MKWFDARRNVWFHALALKTPCSPGVFSSRTIQEYAGYLKWVELGWKWWNEYWNDMKSKPGKPDRICFQQLDILPLPGLWPQGGDPKRSKLCRQRATRASLKLSKFGNWGSTWFGRKVCLHSAGNEHQTPKHTGCAGCTFSAHQTVLEFLFVKCSLVFNRNSSDFISCGCLVQEPRVHTWRCRKEACKVHNHHLIQKCLTGPRDTANSASEDTWDRLSMHPLKAMLREWCTLCDGIWWSNENSVNGSPKWYTMT